ncbi:hypothetical protein [Aeromonas veronii]|uniref:hypothetical protein n=1 Tax=Aeromonas veronii TaxID=654 RepID=UPI00111929B0|nr:hypothetical protein [Aeromonas veronii]
MLTSSITDRGRVAEIVRPVGVSVKIFGLIRAAMLDDRGDNILPWTAFFIEHEHERRKYNKRWKRYGSY